MLQTRAINPELNPALFGLALPDAPESFASMTEKVEFIGFLYETPEQRHPQETAKGWIVRVSGSETVPDGAYSIKVYEDEDPRRVFASVARLITSELPERTAQYTHPIFGLNEVRLSEQAYDLKRPAGLLRKLSTCLYASVRGFNYDFV